MCEPVCPSRNATTTPRQRILLRREMARQPEGSPVLEALLRRVRARRDPDLRRRRQLRAGVPARDRHREADQGVPRSRSGRRTASASAEAAARNWAGVERAARLGLRGGGTSPATASPTRCARLARQAVGGGAGPAVAPDHARRRPRRRCPRPPRRARRPCTCRPASTASSGAHGRRAAAAAGARRRLRPGGPAPVDPRRRRGQLLRDARGAPRGTAGPRGDGPAGRGVGRAVDRRRLAAAGRGRELVRRRA